MTSPVGPILHESPATDRFTKDSDPITPRQQKKRNPSFLIS
jgi:hypothetical protein